MRRILLAATLLLAACTKNNEANEMMSAEDLNAENVAENVTNGAAKVDCDIVGERISQDECDDIRALSKDVRTGAAALDVPDPMYRGRSSQVTLVLDRRPLQEIHRIEQSELNAGQSVDLNASDATNAVAPDEANAAATNDMAQEATQNTAEEGQPTQTPNQVVSELPGRDYTFGSKVGRYMKATLSGQGFDIKLISPHDPVQEIPAEGQGTWIWEVVPRQGGVHSLTARTDAVAIVNGQAKPLGNGVTTKTVTVDVRIIDRIWDFLSALPVWLKLLAAILVAATAVATAWWGLKRALRGKK